VGDLLHWAKSTLIATAPRQPRATDLISFFVADNRIRT
jgi:hypothetical protein